MKVEIELPKLEVIIAEAKKRGFDVELEPINLSSYNVTVTCNGHSKRATVKENCHGKVTLDTDPWCYRERPKDRLRVAVGKTIRVMGDKLSWLLGSKEKR